MKDVFQFGSYSEAQWTAWTSLAPPNSEEEKIVKLSTIPPAYARRPNQAAIDLAMQSADVVLTLAGSWSTPQQQLDYLTSCFEGKLEDDMYGSYASYVLYTSGISPDCSNIPRVKPRSIVFLIDKVS